MKKSEQCDGAKSSIDRPWSVRSRFLGLAHRGRSTCQCDDRQRRQNTNTSATWYWSIAKQAVEWRHRFASKDRVASRGLHYHASTRNLPLIAGGRSDSYNDEVRQFKITELLDSKQAEPCGAHEAAHHPFFTCESVHWAAR